MSAICDVSFFEAFEEEEIAIKRYLPSSMNAQFYKQTIQEYALVDLPSPIISIRTQSHIPPSWKCQAIISRSSGYNHLIPYRDSVACGYLPLYCNRAVAEQTALLWLTLFRKLPKQIKHFSSFDRDQITGYECKNKKLLVVGVGSIGYEVCLIGKGLGMQVMGVDLCEKFDDIEYVSIAKGMREADVVVSAMNLTEHNYHYFSNKLLRTTKKGVVFINISRGELADIAALLELKKEGHIGGIGLDVYEKESALALALRTQEKKHLVEEAKMVLELQQFENVILTPHNAFNTVESVERKAEQSVRQLMHYLQHKKFLWPIPSDARREEKRKKLLHSSL